jgi:hypothetical protein
VRLIDTDTQIHASLNRVAPATKIITQILKVRVNEESKLDNGNYNFGQNREQKQAGKFPAVKGIIQMSLN